MTQQEADKALADWKAARVEQQRRELARKIELERYRKADEALKRWAELSKKF